MVVSLTQMDVTVEAVDFPFDVMPDYSCPSDEAACVVVMKLQVDVEVVLEHLRAALWSQTLEYLLYSHYYCYCY